jgi:hypothetical protein
MVVVFALFLGFFVFEHVNAQQYAPSLKGIAEPVTRKIKRPKLLNDPERVQKYLDKDIPALKADSSLLDTTAMLGQLESLLEEQVTESNLPIGGGDAKGVYFEEINGNIPDSPIFNKLRQQDFTVPKEKLEHAKEELLSEKKKYTSVADTRVKETASKRQSLKHLHFFQRLEFGLVGQFSPRTISEVEVHPQLGYAISKKSAAGIGLRLNWQASDYVNGGKLYFNRQLGANFQWLTEYRFSISGQIETGKIPNISTVPLFTGIVNDIPVKGKLHLRTGVLIPVGLKVFENPAILKQSLFQFGLIIKCKK